MDTIKGFFLFPFYSAFQYTRFTLSSVISLPFFLLEFIKTSGKTRIFKDHSILFKFTQQWPLGTYFFDGIVGFFAPYSASISPHVESCSVDDVTVSMTEMPWLKNPFNSIHAVALANLGELASGLSMVLSMQQNKGIRGIPKEINIEFFKKSRGTIYASSTSGVGNITKDCDLIAEAILTNKKKEVVAKVKVTWSMQIKNKDNNEEDKKKQ